MENAEELLKPHTWQDLKDFINTLTEEQLKKICYVMVDDNTYGKPLLEPFKIDHDVYVNKHDEEDCGSLEELRVAHEEDFKEEDYELATPKGTPFLWIET